MKTFKNIVHPLDFIGVPVLVSILLYGLFGIQWWAPIGNVEPLRLMVLIWFHMFPMFFWVPTLTNRYHDWKRG